MTAQRDLEFAQYVHQRMSMLRSASLLLCAGDEHSAKDLVQETLVRTYVAWGRVRDPQARDAYVRRIMVRLAGRHTPPETPTELGALGAIAGATQQTYDLGDRQKLMTLLRSLPARQRQAVAFRFYEDLSVSQTAAIMNCSEGAVKAHTHRALSKLRSALEGSTTSTRED